MKYLIGASSLALYAAVLCVTLAAEGADAPKTTARGPCSACLEACAAALNYDDSLLDESTDSYLPAAPRSVATAAAIEMAAKLKSIYSEYRAGHFGQVYEANAEAIESLTKKQALDHATSAEIGSLKRVRTALYADAVVTLQADATGTRSQRFAAAYRAREAVLDGVIKSMSARQQMRAAERLAVCEVLTAHEDDSVECSTQ